MTQNGTAFEFVSAEKPKAGAGVLLVPLVAKPQPAMELVSHVDAICEQAVSELIAVGGLRPESGTLAHTSRPGAYRRILVVSLGDSDALDGHRVRTAAAAAARWLMSEKLGAAALWLDGLVASGLDTAPADWAQGMILAGFRFDAHRSDPDAPPAKLRIALCSRDNAHVLRTRPQLREAVTIAESVNFARRLAHEPPNVMHPEALADAARALARESKLKCTVFDEAQLRKQKMNGLLAVGLGAGRKPRLIQLEYRGAPQARTAYALVGKAVTFDTGGYSIKPADRMEEMKFDKCGGMAVFGVLRAVAALKLKVNVVGLIAAAENAISDSAYRPADIIHMMSGKSVEIVNTDAEGRMILADALWYAQRQFKPTVLIDLATLTGGVRVALGTACAGLMTNDDTLAGHLAECGRVTHERLWRLPLWDDYRELIKSTEADIKNSAGKRDAHPIVGGMFLKEFVADHQAWAHLDIAAVATREDNKNPTGKGATGFGIRLLVEYLKRRAS